VIKFYTRFSTDIMTTVELPVSFLRTWGRMSALLFYYSTVEQDYYNDAHLQWLTTAIIYIYISD
jgi:hypothetical protein